MEWRKCLQIISFLFVLSKNKFVLSGFFHIGSAFPFYHLVDFYLKLVINQNFFVFQFRVFDRHEYYLVRSTHSYFIRDIHFFYLLIYLLN